MKTAQPWLHSGRVDSAFILAPALIASVAVILLRGVVDNTQPIPLWAWVSLVLCCDVAHVYATLFRTYLDREKFDRQRTLLISAPIAALIGSVLVFSISAQWFWRVLAYIAVFHFIRQQYGFIRLYTRRERQASGNTSVSAILDQLTIYAATLYPLLYWHCHLPRNFSWFVDGDFIAGLPALAERIGFYLYISVLAAFAVHTLQVWRTTGFINVPKLLVVLGTVCSWYIGIVLFNGDFAFTATNVIAHGIPYMALVWIYSQRDFVRTTKPTLATAMAKSGPLFVLTLLVLAYCEEALWNGLVWRDFPTVFPLTDWLPIIKSHTVLSVLVPLLSLPQLTHYILDGFIWRTQAKAAGIAVPAA